MNRPRLGSLLMYIWLTVGYGIAHPIALAWLISLFAALFFSQTVSWESDLVTDDGKLLIHESGRNALPSYRNLDGSRISDDDSVKIRGADGGHVQVADQTPATTWNLRIRSMHDSRRPTVYWYVVLFPEMNNAAHLVGYDESSRQKIGYLGKNGFSTQPPERNQMFTIPNFSSYVIASGMQPWATEPNPNYGQGQQTENATPDTIWILSEQKIYEIRLASRTVRPLIEDQPDIESLGLLIQTVGKVYRTIILGRSKSAVSLIDPQTKQIEKIELGSMIENQGIGLYLPQEGQRILILSSMKWNAFQNSRQRRALWLTDDGQIDRQIEFELHTTNNYALLMPLGFAACLPCPIVCAGFISVAPAVNNEFTDESTYGRRFQVVFKIFRWWAISSLMIGFACGWACRRREVEVFGSRSWFWPLIVAISGWFGWIGYSCVRRLPARKLKQEWMPSQPEPNARLGTEIYA